jgi:hypothetical protein
MLLVSFFHMPLPPMVSIKYVTFTFTSRQRLSKSEKCRCRYLGSGGRSSPSAYCRKISFSMSSLSLIMFCYVMSPVSSLIDWKCFITQRQTGLWNSPTKIHTLNGSRTCTFCKIYISVTCYTHVLISLCVICFTINYEAFPWQRTKQLCYM